MEASDRSRQSLSLVLKDTLQDSAFFKDAQHRKCEKIMGPNQSAIGDAGSALGEVQELINSTPEELTKDSLMEMSTSEPVPDNEEEDVEEAVPENRLTTDSLTEGFQFIGLQCCVNSACVCGEVTCESQKLSITTMVKKAYHLYFGCRTRGQDKR